MTATWPAVGAVYDLDDVLAGRIPLRPITDPALGGDPWPLPPPPPIDPPGLPAPKVDDDVDVPSLLAELTQAVTAVHEAFADMDPPIRWSYTSGAGTAVA